MNILMVSSADIAGGAERVAWTLFKEYRRRGHECWLGVGLKRTNDSNVLLVKNERQNLWSIFLRQFAYTLRPWVGRVRDVRRMQSWLLSLAEPLRLLRRELGQEDFDFPDTWKLLDICPKRPDIVHCHNLHAPFIPKGGYFDLRALPWLSQQVPVVLTLHDAWLLSGHCAHSFDCERWKTGCGQCPDLTIYPAIRRDATAYNWQRKQKIYARSRLYVATPSRWLMQKVEQSILAPAIVEARVIPNGVDLTTFHPADKREVRDKLGILQDTKVLLFAANGIRQSIWRDYRMMRTAVGLVAERLEGQKVLFIALGEDTPSERIGKAQVQFVPYQRDPKVIAAYYQAADIYVHAAKADTFPNVVLEALACGTPVVATEVGGIPEQIEDGATGFLVPPGDVEMMVSRIEQMFSDDELRREMGAQAAKATCSRFDLEQQVSEYLNWYQETLKDWQFRKGKGHALSNPK